MTRLTKGEFNMKRTIRKIVIGMTFLSLVVPACSSFATGEEKLTSEAIMQQLEEMVQLNSEKMAKLKPEIDATSEKLREMIHESVDKGFVRMEEFRKQFDEISRETEVKVKEFLTSEEYEKFKDLLTKIDKEAIQEAKNEIVQDLNDLLELSEEQINELKPVLEDSVNKMNEMLDTFAKDGAESWAEVASKYDEMSKELGEKLQEILDGSQLEKLEKYKKEKRNKLKDELIEV
jgi:predicted phage tail protein